LATVRQTTLSVPLDVKPESCARLCSLIEEAKKREDTGAGGYPENFARVASSIPVLHFMSMSVFAAADYDPIFIIEANFDGAPGPFWAQMELVFGDCFRAMLRCCKKPLDHDAPLFAAVTDPASQEPVMPYLEARTQHPSVFHHGNRGLSRDRILHEQALFIALRTELDGPTPTGEAPYHALPGAELHQKLRAAMLPTYAWLNQTPPPRITPLERGADILRLTLFVVLLLMALTAPALILAALMPVRSYLLLVGLGFVLMLLLIFANRRGRPGTEIATTFRLAPVILKYAVPIALLVAAYVAAATLVLMPTVAICGFILHHLGAGVELTTLQAFKPVARIVLLGLAGLLINVPLIILWLRHDEMRQSSQDKPAPTERMYREMIRREDWVAQNHMGSVVLIRPGILRSIVIRAGHLGLGLVLRVVATDGYLGSMRTVHFAHWAFLNNGSRLLFFSNFDHSWGSYLDDFIEKAHVGLTLAWGCGTGFPPTRFLIYDGASHGEQFKAWALQSRAVSRFWYSAYRNLTVDQIERNNRIADGLRRPSMTDQEALAWAQDL